VPIEVQARLPLHAAELYERCPVTDVPRTFYDERAAAARREARVLIRGVRRRPDAVSTACSRMGTPARGFASA
jgi:hypothetical protein